MLAARDLTPLDEQDYDSFKSWLPPGRKMHEESVSNWEVSPEYKEHVLKRIAENCRCEL